MKFCVAIANKIQVCVDPELRAVKRIIKLGEKGIPLADKYTRESDEVFLRRLDEFPLALKMCYWENHFEWKSLDNYPEINGKILDFGCGSGHLDVMLARNGRTVQGIDLSPIGVSIANYLKSKEGVTVQERLAFSVADVTKDKPVDELFDSAWSAHVFEHIADPAPILRGLRNWLKPGSHLLISVPLGDAYDDAGHINHFYSAGELDDYLRENVVVKRIDISIEDQVIRALCRFT